MNREVLHVLEEYQKARMEFVHQISALAMRPKVPVPLIPLFLLIRLSVIYAILTL